MTADCTEVATPRLLLVGGVGRSGTSFVQSTLARSMTIGGFEDFESKLFSEPGSLLDLRDFYVDTYSFSRFEWMAGVFVSNVETNFKHLPISGAPGEPTAESVVEAARALVAALYQNRLACTDPAGLFRTHALAFLIRALKTGNSGWLLEKTPHNALHLERVTALFPDTFLVHVVRNPIAVARSLIRQDWYRGSFEEAVIWIRLFYEQLWRTMASPGFPTTRCLTIRIEDCAARPTDIARQIEDFLGIAVGSVDFSKNVAPSPVNDEALSLRQVEFAEAQLSAVLSRYEYQ